MPREKLKRRAVSVLSDFMVYDVTDDEMDEVESNVGRAALQFIMEAKMGELIFYDILVENYLRRCLRAADDFIFVSARDIKIEFYKNLMKAVEEIRDEGGLP